jgi:hypothetical protein
VSRAYLLADARAPRVSPQLACGAVFMLAVWALRIYPAPKARAKTFAYACAALV